jgi:hypothetical protein
LAEFQAASIPESAAVYEHAPCLGPGGAGRARQNVEVQSIKATGLQGQLGQPGVGAKVDATVIAGANPLGPADGLERCGNSLEAVLAQPVEAHFSSDQQRAVGSLAERHGRILRHSVRRIEGLEPLAVKPVDSVFGADPEKAEVVLIDPANRKIR